MPLDDPQVRKFCNEQLRPACDSIISAIRTLRQLQEGYKQVLPALQKAAGDDVIVDGSEADGRTPITVQDVVNAADIATNALLALMDDQGPKYLFLLDKPSVNTQPKF